MPDLVASTFPSFVLWSVTVHVRVPWCVTEAAVATPAAASANATTAATMVFLDMVSSYVGSLVTTRSAGAWISLSRLGRRMDSIVAEELHKRYRSVQALDGVSFAVREGEVFG